MFNMHNNISVIMSIKDKIKDVSLTLKQHEDQKKVRIKKFITISFIIFGLITGLSFLFFTSCNDNVCNTDYIKILNIVIIGFGTIGLIYCFLILRDFTATIDNKIIPEYAEILDVKDEDLKIDDKDKLLCF